MTALPRSLQSLIEEARKAKANTEWSELVDDDLAEGFDEYLDGLSRGEYSQELYWTCVADDAEEEADWEKAKSACSRIIALEESTYFDRSRAHIRLGNLFSLFGDDESALQHYKAASSEAEKNETEIYHRVAITEEARSLMRLERLQDAERLVKRSLAVETVADDSLGLAKLLVALAVCELAGGRLRRSRKTLEKAWQHLEEMRIAIEEYGDFDDASGVHATYASWWRVRAEQLQATQHGDGETDALKKSLEHARKVASQLASPRVDAWIAEILLATADGLEREKSTGEANTYREEAKEIIKGRGLHTAVISPCLIPSRPALFRRRYFFW